METLSKELALAVLMHLHPRDVIEVLLVSRRFRWLFMLGPDDYKVALQHLQCFGALVNGDGDDESGNESEDEGGLESDDGEDGNDGDGDDNDDDGEDGDGRCTTGKERRLSSTPFHRLPISYSLALLAWKGLKEETIGILFREMIDAKFKMLHRSDFPIAWQKPLPEASKLKVEKLLRTTIELGLNIVTTTSTPFAFYLAGKLDSVELVEALIELGQRSTDPTERFARRIALELAAMDGACFTGAANIASHLLAVSTEDLRNGLFMERFPLCTLAKCGHVNVMRVLFDPVDGVTPEFDVDRKFEDSTPLQFAARGNHTETALWLLEHGADAFEDGSGVKMLNPAISNRNTVLVKEVLSRGGHLNRILGGSYLNYAARDGSTEIVRLLVAHGA
ncbi:hypothetical protein HDU96_002952, partial [Phlyctochytrium bullatum]